MPEHIEPDVAPPHPLTGAGSRLARASVVAVAVSILILGLAVYCMVTAPVFHLLAGGARGWLAPLASTSALEIDAMLCRAIVMVAIAISLWGAAIAALALMYDHADVNRRWLAFVGIVAGIAVPLLAVLTLRWAWALAAYAHLGGT